MEFISLSQRRGECTINFVQYFKSLRFGQKSTNKTYENLQESFSINLRGTLRPRSHYSVFVSIRFCCIEATVHTAPFSYKNGEKNLRFCAFTLICPIKKTQRKTSVFVRSHYSVFVKLIVGYWSVFKNLRFVDIHF